MMIAVIVAIPCKRWAHFLKTGQRSLNHKTHPLPLMWREADGGN